ncbi:MAG: hypothetical protein WBC04_06455 [Candidatus Acidiferrales bacterium]
MAARKILFICVGNSCRSQMAEALARQIASDVIVPASAGLSPLGRIAEATRRVLLERGMTVDEQFSKGVNDAGLFRPDLIVNMSGIPGKSLFANAKVEDWEIDDPYGEDLATHRRICDDIEARVQELAVRLRSEDACSDAP